jgi:hypothetical protein
MTSSILAGSDDAFIVALIIRSLCKYFTILPSSAALVFFSAGCARRFCCQQISILSAADTVRIFSLSSADLLFVSRFFKHFLSSAHLFFVSKCLYRRHGNDAHTGILTFAPGRLFGDRKIFAFDQPPIFASITIAFVWPDLPVGLARLTKLLYT